MALPDISPEQQAAIREKAREARGVSEPAVMEPSHQEAAGSLNDVRSLTAGESRPWYFDNTKKAWIRMEDVISSEHEFEPPHA